ncbi:hypothetical protein C357_05563 [Citreicella sp. 357]|nr:hypothetical protein C357_05563 [Citreicella sp. 357]
MRMTRLIALSLTACLLAPPALAQDDDGGGGAQMKRGVQMFLDGFMDELGPALRGLEGMARDAEPALRSFAQEMGPALAELMDEVKDWSVYEAPEMLDNGDIILRRKEPRNAGDPPFDTAPDAEPDEAPLEPRERKGLPPLDGNKIDL